jgi:hypothetical protein
VEDSKWQMCEKKQGEAGRGAGREQEKLACDSAFGAMGGKHVVPAQFP